MALTKKTNHVQEAIGNLVDAVRVGKDGTPLVNTQALVGVFAKRVQELEDVFFDILNNTVLDTAFGETLDNIGTVVGEARKGRSDADYRIALSARIIVNLSSGTIEDVLAVVAAMTSVTASIIEAFPAGFQLEFGDILSNGAEIALFIGEAKPAAVEAAVAWFEETPEFRFDTAGKGFDDGKLAFSAVF